MHNILESSALCRVYDAEVIDESPVVVVLLYLDSRLGRNGSRIEPAGPGTQVVSCWVLQVRRQ